MLNGCIPVIIMDNTHAVFESVLDHTQFTLRVLQKDVGRMPEILKVRASLCECLWRAEAWP